MRRSIWSLAASLLLVAACSGSTGTAAPADSSGGGGNEATPVASTGGGGGNPGASCSYWCGSGSAQVNVGGQSTTVTSGGCYDGGTRGVDFRFGPWWDFAKTDGGDTIIGLVFHGGGGDVTVSGRVGGKMFVLTGATGTIGDDGKGSFSGTDAAGGNGQVSGTFSCK